MNQPILLQRVSAKGVLTTKSLNGRTRIDRLFQEGAAKIRTPASLEKALEAVLINTAGGVTGGDRLDWEFTAGANCALSLTTQASEKVYKAGTGEAKTRIRLSAGKKSRLSWLPQETILFDASAFHRTIHVELADTARLLMVEPLVFGRKAMGEVVRQCAFRDDWRIHVNGNLIHAEAFRAQGDMHETLGRRAIAAGAAAMASVLLIAPDIETEHRRLKEFAGRSRSSLCGVSAVKTNGTGKLLARMIASDGYCLRKTLVPLLSMLNGEAGLPKIWAS